MCLLCSKSVLISNGLLAGCVFVHRKLLSSWHWTLLARNCCVVFDGKLYLDIYKSGLSDTAVTITNWPRDRLGATSENYLQPIGSLALFVPVAIYL